MSRSNRMGAVALKGLRNLPTGVRELAPRQPEPEPTVSRSHSCDSECSCRKRQPWHPYLMHGIPVTIHTHNGHKFALGGGYTRDPVKKDQDVRENKPAILALAHALTAVTRGRVATRNNTANLLTDDTIERARYGISTNDPIDMPAQTRTITYKRGVVITERLTGKHKGERIASLHDERVTAAESSTGAIRYEKVPDWTRKWHRKGKARPFAG
jgi:hypothetical protein